MLSNCFVNSVIKSCNFHYTNHQLLLASAIALNHWLVSESVLYQVLKTKYCYDYIFSQMEITKPFTDHRHFKEQMHENVVCSSTELLYISSDINAC